VELSEDGWGRLNEHTRSVANPIKALPGGPRDDIDRLQRRMDDLRVWLSGHTRCDGVDRDEALEARRVELAGWHVGNAAAKEATGDGDSYHDDGHGTFEGFVATAPPRGLGADVAMIRRVVADDPVALDLLDRAMTRLHGGDRTKDAPCKLDNIQLAEAPTGTSSARALRKLRTDAADLHAEVLAGNLSWSCARPRPRADGFRSGSPGSPQTRREAAVLTRPLASQAEHLRR